MMNDDVVYVNGSLVPLGEAKISAMDRGFLFGDGFFETTRVVGGTPFRMRDHLDRLSKSCLSTGWEWRPDAAHLCEATNSVIEHNGVGEGYLRITVSRGVHRGGLTELPAREPTILIDAHTMELKPLDDAAPLRIQPAPWRRNESCPLTTMKSISYQESLLALARAREEGADEVYFVNSEGALAEGAISNLFFITDGTVRTPSNDQGLLPGIGRDVVLQICREENIPCEEGSYAAASLFSADEVFCTNSLRGVMPVRKIVGKREKSFPERTLTVRLQRLFARRVLEECDG